MIINSKSWKHFFFQSFKTRAFTIKKWCSHLINKSDLETNSQQSKYFKGIFDLIFFSIQLRKRLLCQTCLVIHASKERFEKFWQVSLLDKNRDKTIVNQCTSYLEFLYIFFRICVNWYWYFCTCAGNQRRCHTALCPFSGGAASFVLLPKPFCPSGRRREGPPKNQLC